MKIITLKVKNEFLENGSLFVFYSKNICTTMFSKIILSITLYENISYLVFYWFKNYYVRVGHGGMVRLLTQKSSYMFFFIFYFRILSFKTWEINRNRPRFNRNSKPISRILIYLDFQSEIYIYDRWSSSHVGMLTKNTIYQRVYSTVTLLTKLQGERKRFKMSTPSSKGVYLNYGAKTSYHACRL